MTGQVPLETHLHMMVEKGLKEAGHGTVPGNQAAGLFGTYRSRDRWEKGCLRQKREQEHTLSISRCPYRRMPRFPV